MIPPSAVALIIPARGGSKGIPRKNLRSVGGVPLIGRAVSTSLNATTVGSVWVSTEDSEIEKVAGAYGAQVISRPANLAADDTSSEAVLLHALETLSALGANPVVTVFVQCTAPLLIADDIDNVVRQVARGDADSAFAATYFHGFIWELDADRRARGVNHSGAPRKRRQDLTRQYLETGSVYAFRTDGFRQARTRFFGRVAIHEIPRERCWEVDDEGDLVIAESMLRSEKQLATTQQLPARIGALILDFDGVLTDNRVLVASDGREGVHCSRADGLGLSLLREAGLPMLILSSERDPVVEARARKLSVECIIGVDDKLVRLRAWLADRDIDPADVVYVGNDTNDLSCLDFVGCGVAVADAHPRVRAAAKFVLREDGGHGAVRELAELILPIVEGGGSR